MFQRRHYYFLIDWAVTARISRRAIALLGQRLAEDNPQFDKATFLREYAKRRNYVRLDKRLLKQRRPEVSPGEAANLDWL